MKKNNLILTWFFTVVFLANVFCHASIDHRTFETSKKIKTTVTGGLIIYAWNLNATAGCTHGLGVPYTSGPNSNNAFGMANTLPGFSTWNIANPVGSFSSSAIFGMTALHPTDGYAKGTFSATSVPATKGKFAVNMLVEAELGVYASAKAGAGVKKDIAQATAAVNSVSMKLGSSNISLHGLTGKAYVRSKGRMGKKVQKGFHKTAKRWRDPISLSLTEVETGQVYSQDLFSVNVDMEDYGHGAFTFDNGIAGEGVLLSCDADENILMYGSSDSDWLSFSYGDFSASLSEGIFTTTGAWASLPWQLTHEDPGDLLSDVLSASLSSDYLLTDLAWQIPETLMREGFTYDLDLDWDDSAFLDAVAVAEVPEPMTLSLLAFGGLALLGKRK